MRSPYSVLDNTNKTGAGEKILEPTDIQLWQEFQAGSDTAFAFIYRKYASPLYSYGMKLVNNREQVMDAIQDLFVGLWDRKEKLGKVRSIRSYLYKSLQRKLISGASKRRLLPHSEETEIAENGNASSVERNLIEKETFNREFRALTSALSRLGGKQQQVIHLKYYAQLNYEEIADVMGMDKKAVYNLMAYTLQTLRKSLDILYVLLPPLYFLYTGF
ncbi:hypothetical protein DN748_03285 [Sinomicrobium soli]|nr:hypothetical protein DN748_03285 [Sinomicrobium sp. N-1-3-6]